MALSIFKTYNPNFYFGSAYATLMFNLSTHFSNSSNTTIIDSYSPLSTPNRYKGDPIANSVWTSSSDLAPDGTWFIIQMETSASTQHESLDKWQCKVQCSNNYFYDCSGIDYGYEASIRLICWRFSPFGGWNLEDTNPDFAPTNGQKSSNNIRFVNTASTNGYNYIVYGDGGLYVITRYTTAAQNYAFSYAQGYIGDYIPIETTGQTIPRCALYTTSSAFKLAIGSPDNYSLICPQDGSLSTNGLIDFVDEDGIYVKSKKYSIPPFTSFLNYYNAINKFSTVPSINLLPFYIIPESYGIIGDIPLFKRGYGVGVNLVNDKAWLSPSSSYDAYFKWDGSSTT